MTERASHFFPLMLFIDNFLLVVWWLGLCLHSNASIWCVLNQFMLHVGTFAVRNAIVTWHIIDVQHTVLRECSGPHTHHVSIFQQHDLKLATEWTRAPLTAHFHGPLANNRAAKCRDATANVGGKRECENVIKSTLCSKFAYTTCVHRTTMTPMQKFATTFQRSHTQTKLQTKTIR